MAAKPNPLPRGINHFRGGYRVRTTWQGRTVFIGQYDVLSDAKAALAIAKSEIVRGTFVPPAERKRRAREEAARAKESALTLAELSEAWLENMRRAGRAASTIVTHRSTLNVHLLPVLGDLPLATITPEMIATMLDDITEPIPRRNAARTLQTMLNYAVKTKAGGLTSSPFQYTLAAPRAATGRIERDKVATPAEVERFTAAMPEELALAVPLAAWCALRLGEVLGLARGDFDHLDDPKRATLRVDRQVNAKANALTDPKSGSFRTIALPGFMLPTIRDHLAAHVGAGGDAPVFPGRGVGGRVSQSAFDRAWRAARDQVKPGFVFHDLRHSGLTHFARAGATLAELMARGGHTDVSVALRYQTATEARDRALTDSMEAMLQNER